MKVELGPAALDKTERKAVKLEKWRARAEAHGVTWGVLTKTQRREFRARWRVARSLDKLRKVLGGRELAKAAGADTHTPPPFRKSL